MDKKTLAAVALGAVLGVGGKQAADGLFKSADAAPLLPFVHAVDLRRDYAADDAGISNVRFTAYATERQMGGGIKDIGLATSCKPSEATTASARSLMNVLAKECSW